jgi:hypothetical protein
MMGSAAIDGNNGAFVIPVGPESESYRSNYQCIVSDGELWEHVSVTVVSYTGQTRTPTWDEMCAVKDLFWGQEEAVIQYHPPKSEYVNCHPNVLHLWRPLEAELRLPPARVVGPRQQ